MIEKQSPSSSETLSPEILKNLREVLGENYEYAISVVTYTEVQSLEFNYTGMAEFRDALTHVKRAIYTNDSAKALEELNSASEHIRRAAVESMQEYVETRYVNIRRRLYFPTKYWFKNKEDIAGLEEKVKDNIRRGRELKPVKKWQEAISCFKNAEDAMAQLEQKIPSIDERIYLAKSVTYIIAGLIVGYLIAII